MRQQWGISRKREEEGQGRRRTHHGGRGAHLVDAEGKEADGAEHGDELGEGRRGLDLVHVRGPHGLDVVVLGELRTWVREG